MVTCLVPQERAQHQTYEHTFGVPVLQILKHVVEVERVQQQIDKQIVELLLPQIVEENVDVMSLVQERVHRINEQLGGAYSTNSRRQCVDVPVPASIVDVAVLQIYPVSRVIVDMPVALLHKHSRACATKPNALPMLFVEGPP